MTTSDLYGFQYSCEQYIFLQCPLISPFEIYRFSITSAGDEYLSVGDWTQELEHIFIDNCLPHLTRASFREIGVAELAKDRGLIIHEQIGSLYAHRWMHSSATSR